MSIRCYIVDDEPLAVRVLEKYVMQTPALTLCGTSTAALQALSELQQQRIDLLFLDINMPELSGISLARTLVQPPLLVFTTAYPEFAVEGFELEALDYLVKPFSF
ncbi:MAG: LytR/AlgR family response regulator transcription factor, partial [Saprospiraceae bacterium]